MALLIETSLWIDFTRPRTPQKIKQFVAPFILHPDARLVEPVAFEVLRHASPIEARQIQQQFQTVLRLTTPSDVWDQGARLGQACRRAGVTAASVDLLIAALAIHHGVEVVTFDNDFQHIAAVSSLQVKLLQRPTP